MISGRRRLRRRQTIGRAASYALARRVVGQNGSKDRVLQGVPTRDRQRRSLRVSTMPSIAIPNLWRATSAKVGRCRSRAPRNREQLPSPAAPELPGADRRAGKRTRQAWCAKPSGRSGPLCRPGQVGAAQEIRRFGAPGRGRLRPCLGRGIKRTSRRFDQIGHFGQRRPIEMNARVIPQEIRQHAADGERMLSRLTSAIGTAIRTAG
jgi:hypothetical protein